MEGCADEVFVSAGQEKRRVADVEGVVFSSLAARRM